ncbi:surface glycoprotein [Halospeciosus flavus]|uniref:surface glycoprotein n=1 Tax=Halospeciosus flavus TaxID=3032283 RepID=UPI00361534FC
MTDTNNKIRGLFLAALMVISVFGGSIAFAGEQLRQIRPPTFLVAAPKGPSLVSVSTRLIPLMRENRIARTK